MRPSCAFKLTFVALVFALTILVTTAPVVAQWSSPFATPGADAQVSVLCMHDDGTGEALYAAGMFRAMDGEIVNRIAKLQDGEWQPVGQGFASADPWEAEVRALASYNGELIAGGDFTLADGLPVQHIARWNGVSWQPLGSGVDSDVNALIVFKGELIAGGRFNNAGGQPADRVAAWNGTSWQPLSSGFPGGDVKAFSVFKGDLVAGGLHLTSVPGGEAVAKWDGQQWTLFGAGLDGTVFALTSVGKTLYAVGDLNLSGQPTNKVVAQWDGAEWTLVGGGVPAPSWTVGSSVIAHDDDLIVGCGSSYAVGIGGLFRWDGAAWSTYGGGIAADHGSASVLALLEEPAPNGRGLLVGGSFTIAGPIAANGIARYASDTWSRLTECESCKGLSGPVLSMAKYDDGGGEALYAAGYFRCAGTEIVNYVARWDGQSWQALGDGLPGRLYTLGVFDDGSGPDLWAAGVSNEVLWKWDGAQWTPISGGVQGGNIFAMQQFDEGGSPAFYLGGQFTSVGGTPAVGLTKWDGTTWTAINGIGSQGGLLPTVNSLRIWNNGSGPGLVVGGLYDLTVPPTTHSIAMWRNQQWLALGTGMTSGIVNALAPWPPSSPTSLFAFGRFNVGTAQNIAQFNGSTWSPITHPFGSNVGGAAMLTTSAAGCEQLFIYNTRELSSPGIPHIITYAWNGVAWDALDDGLADASGTTWALSFGGPYTRSYSAFETLKGQLYVAGDFTEAGGLSAGNIAIWDIDAGIRCAADHDNSGVVDVDDLVAVILQWGTCIGTCSADSTPCGGDGVINVDDLVAVILNWGPCW